MTRFLHWIRSIMGSVLNGIAIARLVSLILLFDCGFAGDRPGAGRRPAIAISCSRWICASLSPIPPGRVRPTSLSAKPRHHHGSWCLRWMLRHATSPRQGRGDAARQWLDLSIAQAEEISTALQRFRVERKICHCPGDRHFSAPGWGIISPPAPPATRSGCSRKVALLRSPAPAPAEIFLRGTVRQDPCRAADRQARRLQKRGRHVHGKKHDGSGPRATERGDAVLGL